MGPKPPFWLLYMLNSVLAPPVRPSAFSQVAFFAISDYALPGCCAPQLMVIPRLLSQAELELELIQSHMAQKPMLRGEVGARALRVRSDVRGHAHRLWRPPLHRHGFGLFRGQAHSRSPGRVT
jgi:hypothetical protein